MTGREKRGAANRQVYSAREALAEPNQIVARPTRPTVAGLRRSDRAAMARLRLAGTALGGGAALYALMWLACAG